MYGPYPFPYVTVTPCYPETSWDANRSFLPIMLFLFLLLLAQPQYSFHVCFSKAQEASRYFYFLILSSTCFYNLLLCSIRFYMFLWGGFTFSMDYYLIGNQRWTEELYSCINRLRLSIKDLQFSSFERVDRTSYNFIHLPTPPMLLLYIFFYFDLAFQLETRAI